MALLGASLVAATLVASNAPPSFPALPAPLGEFSDAWGARRSLVPEATDAVVHLSAASCSEPIAIDFTRVLAGVGVGVEKVIAWLNGQPALKRRLWGGGATLEKALTAAYDSLARPDVECRQHPSDDPLDAPLRTSSCTAVPVSSSHPSRSAWFLRKNKPVAYVGAVIPEGAVQCAPRLVVAMYDRLGALVLRYTLDFAGAPQLELVGNKQCPQVQFALDSSSRLFIPTVRECVGRRHEG